MITVRQAYKAKHGHALGTSPGKKATDFCNCPKSLQDQMLAMVNTAKSADETSSLEKEEK